jgi:hypothetical protein
MELNNCILKRRAFNKLVAVKAAHGLNFFRVAAAALQNDLYAGAHRALETHPDSASFWYIKNIAPDLIDRAAAKSGVSLAELERLAAKLKPIRDQVHSHIDRSAIDDPDKPWVEANITGNEFILLTESAHEVLRHTLLELTKEDLPVPTYDGDDIELIIRAYKKEYPGAPVSV